MTPLRVDFAGLYARHLCRHSQFGINVVHLAALFGVWYGVYGIIYYLLAQHLLALSIEAANGLAIALAVGYLALVARNAPVRVTVATAGFLGLFLAALFLLPELPIWVYLLMIPVFYEVQSLSHKVWTAAADMTEYNKIYPKGQVLFVVLLINEVPLVLNYLLFDPQSRRA
jgi:hypothetical protein